MNKIEFIGWVPCLTGNLYFENTSSDVIGEGYLNINVIELETAKLEQHRHIVIASKVDWKDFDTEADGNWYVILIAKALINSNFVEGKVFLIPSENPLWIKKLAPILKNLAQKSYDKKQIQDDLPELENILINEKNSSRTFVADFILKNSGITYLSYNASMEDVNANTNKIVCRQSFYFIKYTFHKHKHHAPSETLTTIHEYSEVQDVVGLELISDLRKGLVTLSRDCDPADYKNLFSAKGVVTYAKSLVLTCKKEGLLKEETYNSESIFLNNISESLEILGKRVEGGIIARLSFNSNFRSICIFIFALIAPLTLIYRDKITANITESSSQHVIKLLSILFTNESHILAVAIIITALYFILRYVNLKYGSVILAMLKFKRISDENMEKIVQNKRSGKIVMNIFFVIACIFLISSLIRMLS